MTSHPWGRLFPSAELDMHVKDYQYLRSQVSNLSYYKRNAIARGLGLEVADHPDDTALLLHPIFQSSGNRERLRPILTAFSLRHRYANFSKELAMIASIIFALSANESAIAYAFLTLIFHRFCLEDCVLDYSSVESEVSRVLADFSDLCPEAAMTVMGHQCSNKLFEVVESWMRTMLVSAFAPDKQDFKWFFMLIDRVVQGPHEPSNPRRFLRHVIVCVLFNNASRILKAAENSRLDEYLDDLSSHIPVDHNLLQLIDAKLSPENYALYHRCVWTPISLFAGWCAGSSLGSVVAASVAGGGAAFLGPVGAIMASVLTWRFVTPVGYSALQENAHLMLTNVPPEEEEDADNEEDDAPNQSSVVASSLSRAQHPSELALIRTLNAIDGRPHDDPSVPEAEDEEPGLDFYLEPQQGPPRVLPRRFGIPI